MKQFVYRELFFAANTFFFLQNKTKQKKGLYFADKKNKILTHFIIWVQDIWVKIHS